ncbi:MAG: hypothetical protein SV760_05555, partial [Halobacteria archaeon]|nr:hypothetical protein [Halobacteria archaeon]
EQVRRAIEEASRPNDTDGGDVSVTRTQYEKSLRPFYSGSLSDLPRHRTYYVRRENVVYRIGFEVLGEG